MSGVSTPAMAAAVSNAGGLGSLGVGSTDAAGARAMIAAFRERSNRSLHVNVFCHARAKADQAREAAWIARQAGRPVKLLCNSTGWAARVGGTAASWGP